MTCGKLKYPSRQAAKRALERVVSQRQKAGNECRFYYCADCSAYHLTSLRRFR